MIPDEIAPGRCPGGVVSQLYVDGVLCAEHVIAGETGAEMIGNAEAATFVDIAATHASGEVVQALYDGDTGQIGTLITIVDSWLTVVDL